MEISRQPESRCLNCGTTLSGSGGEGEPSPGDLRVCLHCGAVMKFGPNLETEGFTDEEMQELLADQETMDMLARVVKKVYLWRAQRN